MGNACQACAPYRSRTALVRLHIYDFSGQPAVSSMNSLLHPAGSGAYHVGVEVYDKEWSYCRREDGSSGVFSRQPGESTEHTYREAERMGRTELSQREVEALLDELAASWPGCEYHILHKNSGHFCDELCRRLGVGPLPDWVISLASKGATVDDQFQKVASDVRAAAGAMATRASELGSQLQLGGAAAAQVQGLRVKAKELDSHLGLTAATAGAAAKAKELDARLGLTAATAGAAAKAKKLDAQLGLTVATAGAAAKAQGLAAQAADSARSALRSGKEARGASESDNYRFGDFTRGLMQNAWGNGNGADGSAGGSAGP